MDFTIENYKKILVTISENYETVTVREYLENTSRNKNFIIIRHDVDRSINNALMMASIEENYRVNSTYYFRYPHTFKIGPIEEISSMGHEVGYHYETLAKSNGDYGKAKELFAHELGKFREHFEVYTISMHGKPLSIYDCSKLWDRYSYEEYDILGDATRSIQDDRIHYLSDTGRNFGNHNNIRDTTPLKKVVLENIYDVLKSLENVTYPMLYLNIHPERWAYSTRNWLVGYFRDRCFNLGKSCIYSLRNHWA
jgi:hypothetical protein